MAVIEPKPLKVFFIQNHCPALTAGKYQLTATHGVTVGGDAKTSSPKEPYKFQVRGDRFSLPPGVIRRVFPPDGARGEFAGTLPHVVLARDTLPWEREPFDPQKDRLANKDKAPWLAVLVLDADDPNAKIKTGNVSDLQSSSTVAGYAKDIPAWLADEEQDPKTTCRYIELSSELFNAVAPSEADLAWLAHVRHVLFDDNSAAELATVMASRFPQPGKKSIAVLVSLEGLGDCLPDGDGNPALDQNSHQPMVPSIIRLIVLKDWSFTAITEKVTFSTAVRGLNQGGTAKSLLQLPTAFLNGTSPAGQLDAGYVALSHRMRTGYSTISWYRGPLAPAAVSVSNHIGLPVEDADGITFFDTTSGMLNTSYAAAWQIGRLLALADQDFSTKLYAWKRQCRALACELLQHDTAAVGQRKAYADARNGMLVDKPAGTLKDKLKVLDTGDTQPADPNAFFFPLDLKSWLADLALFHRVPFHYLVPDEGMLPAESLRFFTVDATWRRALLDGAFSIGRGSWPAFDHVYGEDVFAAAEKQAKISGAVTGALLRSRLVSGWWPGLIFEGFADAKKNDESTLLKHLRLERLAADVVILLADGGLNCLKIHEPPEGLHFGLRVEAYQNGAVALWQKELRSLDPSVSATYGQESTDPGMVLDGSSIPFRYGQPGVLKVDALAQLIKSKYKSGAPPSFTAAEFALSMIEGVEGGVFFKSNAS
jgi:hypothetical protein